MLNRASVFGPAMFAAVLALGGCDRSPEAERRDVVDARKDALEVEQKAAKEKAEIDRKATADRKEVDDDVAKANAKVAVEIAEAMRAENDKGRTLGQKLDERMASFDKKMVDMKADVKKLTGPAKVDADKSVVDFEKRRTSLQTDVDKMGAKTEAVLDDAQKAADRSLTKLEADIDAATARIRAAVTKG